MHRTSRRTINTQTNRFGISKGKRSCAGEPRLHHYLRELGAKMEVDMNIVDKELPPSPRWKVSILSPKEFLTLGKVEAHPDGRRY